MDFLNSPELSRIFEDLINYGKQIGVAVAALVLGWFGALILRWACSGVLKSLKVNKRFQAIADVEFNLEKIISGLVFFSILFVFIVIALKSLSLDAIAGPVDHIVNGLLTFMPKFLMGSMWTIFAVALAFLAKASMKRLFAIKIDARFGVDPSMKALGSNISEVFFWVVVLLFLPVILESFGTPGGMTAPVSELANKIFAWIPNFFGFGVAVFVGWIVATVLKNIVTSLLASVGLDNIGKKIGLERTMTLSTLLGYIVYALVILTALSEGFSILGIEAISQPATAILNDILNAIPKILTSAVILVMFWLLAKFTSEIISNLLGGLGFNAVPKYLGLDDSLAEDVSPSKFVGKVVMFFIMLFGVTEAAQQVGFSNVSEQVTMFVAFGKKVVLGTVILGVGFWIANMVYKAVASAKSGGVLLANVVRVMIIGLVLSMGLSATGIAQQIVNTAFTLTLGAVAIMVGVGGALAFGLGGREAAGKLVAEWFKKLK